LPLEIPAGQTYQLNVDVMPLPHGEADLSFELYVDAHGALFTESISHQLKLVEAEQAVNDK
jgi:hypothetical protein